MAATRPFAEVLLDTPMLDAAMVDKYGAERAAWMQLIEQASPDFFGDQPLPSGDARNSLYSSRSRGGLAPQSGVQARLDLLPANVLAWQDFEDEVGWNSFGQAVGFGDVPVSPIPFATSTQSVRTLSEKVAFIRLNDTFIYPVFENVISDDATTSPNSWTPLDIDKEPEAPAVGHRVDLTWTIKAQDANERIRFGIADPNVPFRARFLVHEHKSPAKFPYGLTQDDLTQMAQTWMQGTNASLDEAKETVNGAWELACEDLTEYWELGGSFADRESSVRFRYPIIQIYVYMLRSFCKYGVLSTTDKTWFFKLDPENVLYVSRAFHAAGAGDESTRYAYTCMLHHSATDQARLALDEAHLRAICQMNIRLGSYEWTQIYERFGYGDGSGATSSTGRRGTALPRNMVNNASNEQREELRQLLPLKSDLHFPYAGGLLDVIKQFPEGQYGFSIRVDTGGVDTVVKVMTPSKSTDVNREAEFAFWNEMDVYTQLRSLWGTHVPWYLYGGRHIFNDLIVATTYAGESLNASLLNDDIRTKALAALTAVHAVGVAHRDVLLRNFVMDAAGAIRIIDFAQAKTNASHRDLQKDLAAFEAVFSCSETRGRRTT